MIGPHPVFVVPAGQDDDVSLTKAANALMLVPEDVTWEQDKEDEALWWFIVRFPNGCQINVPARSCLWVFDRVQ